MIQLIDFFKRKPQALKLCLITIGVAVFIWSLTVDTSHGHTWMERYIPGFWALFGILSCIVVIFVARWFSQAGVTREEDYYDN